MQQAHSSLRKISPNFLCRRWYTAEDIIMQPVQKILVEIRLDKARYKARASRGREVYYTVQ